MCLLQNNKNDIRYIVYVLYIYLIYFLYFSFVWIYQCYYVWFSYDVILVQFKLVVCFCDNWFYCGYCCWNLYLYWWLVMGGSVESIMEERIIFIN